VADEMARARRIAPILRALRVALLRLLDLAADGGDHQIASKLHAVLDQRSSRLDVARERALHVRDPEAVDPAFALEPLGPEAGDPAQPRLVAGVGRVEVPVEHERRPPAAARERAEDVRASVFDLLPQHVEAETFQLRRHHPCARLLRAGERGRGDEAQGEIDQSVPVDHRNPGSTRSPNSRI
jgi:hypothetical protein